MSIDPHPYPARDPLDPPAEPRRRRAVRPLILGLAGLLVLGGAVAGVWWTQRGPGHPDEWDARVRAYVEIVEEERGLEFEHPVHIDFLSEAQFEEEVTAEESDFEEDELEDLKAMESVMRAVGLLGSDVDLLDSMNDLMGGGVIGLYDAEDERIRMRGTELTPDVRSTLVHELTHALQDQHFDLEEKTEQHQEDDDSSAAAVWSALLEGDADRVETAWAESLSAADLRALEKAQSAASESALEEIAGVPTFLMTQLSASYAFGAGLIGLTLEVDGQDAVDALFESPPTSEEALVDPWTAVEDEVASPVAEPEIPEGAKEVDAGTFGAPTLLFMLAERIAPRTALVATDGWGGDQYVAYEQDDRTCVRLDYVGDSPRDVAELTSALRSWIARGPQGGASVTVEGEGLRLESCESTVEAPPGTGGSETALQMVSARALLATDLLGSDAPKKFIRCYADAAVRALTAAELGSDSSSPAVDRKLGRAAQNCL